MTETTFSEAELSAREVDRLRPLHVLAVVACALALGFDLAEFAIGTVLSALFSAPPYSVAPTQLSWLLASVYLGVIAGASAAGWLADRFGRRLVILVALAIIGATSIMAAACSSIVALAIVRGLSGLALGAYPPLMAAYLTDILPSSRRGPLIMATVAIGAIGPPAVIFLVRWLTPLEPFGIEAWRWAFIAGAAVAAICLLLFALIPESPRWLASQGRFEAARKAYARFGLTSSGVQHRVGQNKADAAIQLDGPVFIRRVGFLLLIYFLVPWSTAGFPLLSAVVLVEKGVSVNDSLLYAGVSSFGPTMGTLLAGLAIDRIERKTALLACAFLMALLGFAFDIAELPIWIMSSGLIYTMVIAIFLPILVIYTAELVPTAQRARATSWSWASRGAGASLVPLSLLPLLHSAGTFAIFAMMAATLAAFAVVVAVFGPKGAAGRSVE